MDEKPGVLIAILGAGRGLRFGKDKLSMDCAGKPVGRWALDAALGTGCPVIWIGGENPPDFIGQDCALYINPDAHAGLSSSLRLAARMAGATAAQALLVLLGDMPMVTTDLLQRLIRTGPPSACLYPAGFPGVPALFPASLFRQLGDLSGDAGAGPLLRSLPHLQLIKPDRSSLLDVDTEDDLKQAATLLGRQRRW